SPPSWPACRPCSMAWSWISPAAVSSGPTLRATEQPMQLLIDPKGEVRCLYGEAIDLAALGPLTIRRASHVEPDVQGRWWADLAPDGGPKLGPFDRRTQALDAERVWLEAQWLASPPLAPPPSP